MRASGFFLFALFGVATVVAAADQELPSADALKAMTARFAPVDIRVDVSNLPRQERAVLAKLIEASRYVDSIFLRQRAAARNVVAIPGCCRAAQCRHQHYKCHAASSASGSRIPPGPGHVPDAIPVPRTIPCRDIHLAKSVIREPQHPPASPVPRRRDSNEGARQCGQARHLRCRMSNLW